MRKNRFIANVFIMTFSMLLIRIVGMGANIYIAGIAGAQAMGFYHMIFSVFTFGITFASSGTGFAVTRLIAEKKADEKSILKKCLLISLVMSAIGFLVFFVGAPYIESYVIKDTFASSSLRILSFAMPCMACSSVFRGYFIAKRKAGTLTLSSLFEECICIGTTMLFLGEYAGTPKAYTSLIYGCALSNLAALVFDITACKINLDKSLRTAKSIEYKPIFAICVPIALGSYLRCALVTLENLMIPMQFAKYGTSNPVGEYGVIKGMAISVVMFPAVFVQGFSSLLVPEISEMNASARKNGIRYVSAHAISAVMMFGVFVALMLYCHHDVISSAFYKEPQVSMYLGYLSLWVIPLYLDTLADSILKGMDMQNSSLKYNIADSALRIMAIYIFMPRLGPVFYILMLYISEIFNLTLSLGKASEVCNLKPDWFGWITLPFGCALAVLPLENSLLQTLVYVGLYYLISKIWARYRILQ